MPHYAGSRQVAVLRRRTGGNESLVTYDNRVLITLPVAYWPLNDAAMSPVVASSVSGIGNGVITGATPAGNTFLDGSNAITEDGSGDTINMYSAGLASAWNGNLGSMLCWAKVTSGFWTDGNLHTLFHFEPGTFDFQAYKSSNNAMQLRRRSTEAVSVGSFAPTDWFCVLCTWDYAGTGQFNAYTRINGDSLTLRGTANAISNAATATLPSNGATLGSNGGGALPWLGAIRAFAIWDRVLDVTERNDVTSITVPP